ncbi:antitoxin HicB [Pasteurella testudinis DSM 23072]|uniref:Antitoxin HicB n=1 Tax=Pasteurella testudinis DSM 23072 TaxID=1122938 RepID=A0A1W1V5Z3_9PAST|nr:type II toxin-antitoxin system HicB family antitoxin [Pasteurella testudinis]SMB88481.1 antitoxin HicB [Pasteurella testudinis DSM 23072]SUB51621.1 Antitoxin HicB [Pasteurella testudinis]
MYYAAHFTPADEGGFVVTFPDIPEGITQGDTFEEAMEMAEDVLLSCVEIYFEEDKPFPVARNLGEGETPVAMPNSVYAKVLLHNAMIQQSITKAQLARLASIRPPEVGRILEPRHTTKIDTISRAFRALGKELQLSVI